MSRSPNDDERPSPDRGPAAGKPPGEERAENDGAASQSSRPEASTEPAPDATPEPATPDDDASPPEGGLAQLLERARDDSEAGFEVLVELEQDHVFSESYFLTGSVATATALSRDVFLRLFVGLAGSREMSESDEAARRWLDRIVLNVVLHQFDRERARRLRTEGSKLAPAEAADSLRDDTPRPAPRDPADDTVDPWVAYDRLDDRARAALVLRDRHRLDYREIADALDTTIGSVKSILVDARRLALSEECATAIDPDGPLGCASLSLCYDDEGPKFLRREVESAVRKNDRVRKTLEKFRALTDNLASLPVLQAPASILEEVRDRIRDETRPLPPEERSDLVDTAELTMERRSRPLRAILILTILGLTLMWLASVVLRRLFE